jgi:hypothetical protein
VEIGHRVTSKQGLPIGRRKQEPKKVRRDTSQVREASLLAVRFVLDNIKADRQISPDEPLDFLNVRDPSEVRFDGSHLFSPCWVWLLGEIPDASGHLPQASMTNCAICNKNLHESMDDPVGQDRHKGSSSIQFPYSFMEDGLGTKIEHPGSVAGDRNNPSRL